MRGWSRWPIFAVATLIAVVILSLYGTVVIGAVTKVLGVDDTLTLDYLKEVLVGVGHEAKRLRRSFRR
jgi:iron(III) transport system permease protein